MFPGTPEFFILGGRNRCRRDLPPGEHPSRMVRAYVERQVDPQRDASPDLPFPPHTRASPSRSRWGRAGPRPYHSFPVSAPLRLRGSPPFPPTPSTKTPPTNLGLAGLEFLGTLRPLLALVGRHYIRKRPRKSVTTCWWIAFKASLAQRQSNGFVNRGSSVQSRQLAPLRKPRFCWGFSPSRWVSREELSTVSSSRNPPPEARP